MIDRRTFVAGCGAALACSPLSAAFALVPDSRRLAFVIIREGSEIGSHVLKFKPSAKGLVVDVDVSIVVKLGPIPLFRYTHRAAETWENDAVVSLVSETNDNGKPHKVRCVRKGDALAVSGTVGNYVAPAGAMPATHWNRAMLDGPMINTQDGKLLKPRIAKLGKGPVAVSGGKTVSAERFALSGDVDLETWYDASRAWVGLSFKGEDGSEIRYQRA